MRQKEKLKTVYGVHLVLGFLIAILCKNNFSCTQRVHEIKISHLCRRSTSALFLQLYTVQGLGTMSGPDELSWDKG